MASLHLSIPAHEALELLGSAIRANRIRKRWSSEELAERVGVSRATISKVEHGDATVAIGTYFEAALLVGIDLFGDGASRHRMVANKRDELVLLPATARRRKRIDDDF
jgi:transcriptional regulator with XRE-family HTH domain